MASYIAWFKLWRFLLLFTTALKCFWQRKHLPHVGLKPDVIRNVSHQDESVLALLMIVFVSSFSVKAVAGNWLLSLLQSVGDWESYKHFGEFWLTKDRISFSQVILADDDLTCLFSPELVMLKLKVQHSLSIFHMTYIFPMLSKLVSS